VEKVKLTAQQNEMEMDNYLVTAETLIRKAVLEEIESKNRYPQCRGLVLTVEDWERIKEGK